MQQVNGVTIQQPGIPEKNIPATGLTGTATGTCSTPQAQNTTPPKVALYRKLWAVMDECGYIQKDKKNTFHGYSYASESAIKARLHDALVKHRLLFLPSSEITERAGGFGKPGKDGAPGNDSLTTLRVTFRFVDIDTGEFESGECVGTGIDVGDKGAYKALTGAIKYILTSWFVIATGDDPEVETKPQDGSLTRGETREMDLIQRERERYTRDREQQRQTAERKPPSDAGAAAETPLKSSDMEHAFKIIRQRLGEQIWAEQLALSGVESITQFRSIGEKREFYKRLLIVQRSQEAAA